VISMTFRQYRRNRCIIDGRSVSLTPMFAETLATLLAAGPRFVSRSELIESIWGNPEHEPATVDHQIDRCVLGLRRCGVIIETHWKQGWRVPLWAREETQMREAA
jgi:DNA-binding response OmpR family regulator